MYVKFYLEILNFDPYSLHHKNFVPMNWSCFEPFDIIVLSKVLFLLLNFILTFMFDCVDSVSNYGLLVNK